ncbi:MAG: hypothetical protein JST30_06000 [Armatimonadetes bacterium]|nr:hypothetical protein [Armatimonadota bacterium]
MPSTHPVQEAAVELLRECFEGIKPGAQGTWFVQGQEGVFDAVDSLTAERASASPGPGLATIAAHVNHMIYTLQGVNVYAGGKEPEGTWEDTWKVQSVDEARWKEMVQTLHREYETFRPFYEGTTDWSVEDSAIGGLAILPHLAYHLGAVRQLLKLV